ncbi:ATP-binding protein [Paenibacillus radicis (ex Xue et al. 2023)]|uniref:ATP-binding protein n=1 Tax=Paenibacillus radicis (ex Xue et al. 2023) TaxID=2972489 RepID=A0ABT1YKV5_9BACL|nr:ATP-binding protein [Paenibacillus radicis (ex Xue et al. 2023)]MCR8633803.1 ATP-binding protein [Paenibacillus radicis (ex Xue et al. 2023)]
MNKQVSMELRNDLAELIRLRDWFIEWSGPLSIDPKMLFHLNLVCDELITNTILYGYGAVEEPEEHIIEVHLTVDGDDIELLITDDGIAFDPLSLAAADITLGIDERAIGGLGIHFVREVMDEVAYERIGEKNTIRLRKIGQRPLETEGTA